MAGLAGDLDELQALMDEECTEHDECRTENARLRVELKEAQARCASATRTRALSEDSVENLQLHIERADFRVAELEAKVEAADRLADSCSSRFSLSLGATILAFSRSALDDYSKARASAAAKGDE